MILKKKIAVVSTIFLTFACCFQSLADTVSISKNRVYSVTAQQSDYDNIVISRVSNFVNVRAEANINSAIVGKIYNNCAATILNTISGEGGNWYHIQSGNVTGYIKAEYFVTGTQAESIAKSIGKQYVTINTDTLRLRQSADTTSNTLSLLSKGERYFVVAEEGDFYKVQVDTDLTGYIAKAYCMSEIEFNLAVTTQEEQKRIADNSRRKNDAVIAISNLQQTIASETGTSTSDTMDSVGNIIIPPSPIVNENTDIEVNDSAPQTNQITENENTTYLPQASITNGNNSNSNGKPITVVGTVSPAEEKDINGISNAVIGKAKNNKEPATETKTSSNTNDSLKTQATITAGTMTKSDRVEAATRKAIVAYAKQFLGNAYVFGGTSLIDGVDCSGFTQAVFAHFGITTGRSSRDQAQNGKAIRFSQVNPGDLLFYSGSDGGEINHVALYIGNGNVIHASNERTGIIISKYNYRTPCKYVTFIGEP